MGKSVTRSKKHPLVKTGNVEIDSRADLRIWVCFGDLCFHKQLGLCQVQIFLSSSGDIKFYGTSVSDVTEGVTLPPQQAKTQRMRLKMRSNPNEDEGGQQPITVVLTTKAGARMNFFP